jgi:hypothetical protein
MKQTTGVFAVLTAALFLGSMAGVGCGDDDTGSGGTGGTGGSAGSGGTAGKGGTGGSTGGTAGTGGSAGTVDGGAGKAGSAGSAGGGGDAPTTITCGTRTCGPITGAAGQLTACCPMGEPNACGGVVTQAANACITATPGTTDATCPSITAQIPLAGCCRPNGMCGVSASLLGLGCADPTALGGRGDLPCGRDAGPTADTGPDTGTPDTGTPDSSDDATGDTGTTDTGTTDTGTGDATGDTGTGDTGTGDAAGDTGSTDAPTTG